MSQTPMGTEGIPHDTGGDPVAGGAWEASGSSDHGFRLWPILIVVGLTLVVLINAIFIYIAVSGADDVVPSYVTEER